MRRLTHALIVVFLGLSPLACSGDDDPPTGLPTGDPDLVAMVGCLSEGLVHVGLALETGLILYHELDPGETLPFTPPPEFSYNSDTGAFEHSWTIGSQTMTAHGGSISWTGTVQVREPSTWCVTGIGFLTVSRASYI